MRFQSVQPGMHYLNGADLAIRLSHFNCEGPDSLRRALPAIAWVPAGKPILVDTMSAQAFQGRASAAGKSGNRGESGTGQRYFHRPFASAAILKSTNGQ